MVIDCKVGPCLFVMLSMILSGYLTKNGGISFYQTR